MKLRSLLPSLRVLPKRNVMKLPNPKKVKLSSDKKGNVEKIKMKF